MSHAVSTIKTLYPDNSAINVHARENFYFYDIDTSQEMTQGCNVMQCIYIETETIFLSLFPLRNMNLYRYEKRVFLSPVSAQT